MGTFDWLLLSTREHSHGEVCNQQAKVEHSKYVRPVHSEHRAPAQDAWRHPHLLTGSTTKIKHDANHMAPPIALRANESLAGAGFL